MTKLRVLTGDHAGANLELPQARMRVGPSEDLDVFIGDWNAPQIELQCDDAGRCVARWSVPEDAFAIEGQTTDDDGIQRVLEPWVPVRFGAVILCIGPSDEPWPDDAQLLQRCFEPAVAEPPAAEPERRGPLGAVMMTVMAAVVGLISSATLSRSEAIETPLAAHNAAPASAIEAPPVSAATPPVVAEPVQRVRDALDQGLRDSLEIVAVGDRVMVRGVLSSRSAVDELHHQLNRLPAELAVSRRVMSAGEISDRLQEALRVSGLEVKQIGPTEFELSGVVDDVARTTRAVQPVAADLAEWGLHIHLALQSRKGTAPSMSGMLIDNQGTSFMRTRDGVKHIVSAAQPAAPSGLSKGTRPSSHPNAPQAPENHHATR